MSDLHCELGVNEKGSLVYNYKPGDVLFSRSRGFLGWAIRLFTRRWGESRTKVNHVGVFVTNTRLVEALGKGVKEHTWPQVLANRQWQEVAVFRPRNLQPVELNRIARRARSHVGKPYGYLKIVAQALDGLLFGAYVFRRMARLKRYPICSWLVADAYAAVGKDFGVPTYQASPDDIWDFVVAHPDVYECVQPLQRVR